MFLSIPERNMSAGFHPRCGPRGEQPAGWTKQPDYPPETPPWSGVRHPASSLWYSRVPNCASLFFTFLCADPPPFRAERVLSALFRVFPHAGKNSAPCLHGMTVSLSDHKAITFRLTASIQRATVPHNSIHRRVFVMQQAQKRGQLGSYVYSYIYAPRRYDAGEVRTCSRGA